MRYVFGTIFLTLLVGTGCSVQKMSGDLGSIVPPPPPPPRRVSLLAGIYDDYSGFKDGVGSEARFGRPTGLTTDGTSLYLADISNNVIRKIDIATRTVTTLAGMAGAAGSTDGVGSDARFNFAWKAAGLTLLNNVLYISDGGNNTIRKMNLATREVTTIAGTPGQTGSTDGTGAAARFNSPGGIASDGTYLYIIDIQTNLVRRVHLTTAAVDTLIPGAAGLNFNGGSSGAYSLIYDSAFLYFSDLQGKIFEVSAATGSKTDWATGCQLLPQIHGSCYGPPWGYVGTIAIDSAFFYLADSSINVIRKINRATGVATVIAGSYDIVGAADGVGSAAQFNLSQSGGIAVVGQTLYVADAGNYSIRAIDLTTNTVSTFAGGSSPVRSVGAIDGSAATARFSHPTTVATDGSSVFVADANNNSIRRVDRVNGQVSTLAGGFDFAYSAPGLAVDANFIYVAEYWTHIVHKVDKTTGAVSTLAGLAGTSGSTDGTGAAARFNHPTNALLYAGDLYVGDNTGIRKVNVSTGAVTTVKAVGATIQLAMDASSIYYAAGCAVHKIDRVSLIDTLLAGDANYGSADGVGAAARFNWLQGMVLVGGSLYLNDNGWRIRKLEVATATVTSLSSVDIYTFNYLTGGGRMATDGTYIYIPSTIRNEIKRVDINTWKSTTLAGIAPFNPYALVDGEGANARVSAPYGMATDGTNLYFADNWNSVVRKVDLLTGMVTTLAGNSSWAYADGPGAQASFNGPWGLVIDGDSLYTADGGNNVIRKIAISTGEVTTLAGQAGHSGSTDGVGTSAKFNLDWGGDLTIANGALYVADYGNNIIRKVVIATGEVTTLAGTAGVTGSNDGTGPAAQFELDYNWGLNCGAGMATDGTYLYVSEALNNTIRRIDIATATVTTFAGHAGVSGSQDGPRASARFGAPCGLSLSGSVLYVVDSGNSTIRTIDLETGEVSTLAGTPGLKASVDGIIPESASFSNPLGILATSLRVFVTEWTSIRVIR